VVYTSGGEHVHMSWLVILWSSWNPWQAAFLSHLASESLPVNDKVMKNRHIICKYSVWWCNFEGYHHLDPILVNSSSSTRSLYSQVVLCYLLPDI
jgi:hypothetical protein